MTDEQSFFQVHVDNLHPNPDNPRNQAGDISELADSLVQNGLLQPLLVRPSTQFGTGHYLIEAGFRRWTACRLRAGAPKFLDCKLYIPTADMDPREHSIEVGLVENMHREDLNPIEKARGMGKLHFDYGRTQKQIATKLGITDATVNHYLALLELDDASQLRVIKGTVTVQDAVAAVRQSRARQRRKEGRRSHGVSMSWEPDHFTERHPLAQRASVMCDARGHNRRRRLGKKGTFKGACGQCWESAIRQDQDIVGGIKADIGDEAAGKVLTELTRQPFPAGGNHSRS